jgi:tRNA C32,U32 (ribose-2'-O)-methylase TrmJ
MKLAEALVLRADTKKRLEQMRARMALSALVQEGEKPPEEPQMLLAELGELVAELERLIVAINRTNAQTTLPTNRTLTEALAKRDALDLEFSLLNGLLEAASNRVNRYSRTEIKLVSTVDVVALRQRLDDTARRRRELDTLIQGANWATDLLE